MKTELRARGLTVAQMLSARTQREHATSVAATRLAAR